MKITVAIPTLGARSGLERLFEALALQDFPASEREVLVVGNCESALLRELVGRWTGRLANLALEFTNEVGVNRARNLALDRARGEIVVFFDDDCLPRGPSYLTRVAELHGRFPDAWAIGGHYETSAGAGELARAYVAISRHSLARASFGGDVLKNRPLEAVNLLGGNVSYKRGLLGHGWRFDPGIVFGGAETEFHARLVAGGARLMLAPSLAVEHRVELSLFQFLRRAYLQGRAFALLSAQGLSPRLTLHPSLAPAPRTREAQIFRFAFRLGSALGRIELYEFGKYWRLRELARQAVSARIAQLRESLFLRELFYSWLAWRGRETAPAAKGAPR